jgi:hypothetical protein
MEPRCILCIDASAIANRGAERGFGALPEARVFRSRLGLTAGNADVLRIALLDAARNRQNDLRPTDIDEYGQRYMLDFEMTVGPGNATIR